MTYVVTAPYVTIKVPTLNGQTLVGLYVGAPIPAGADAEAVARLLRKGMLAEVERPEPEAPETTAAEPGGRPKDYASKGEWVDYAVTLRDDDTSEYDARTAAEGKTKDALIAEHG